MENAAIGKNKNRPQEALGQKRSYKLRKWKTKACLWIKKTGDQIIKAGEALGRKLLKARVNWVSVLALVILANMAEKGAMDNISQLKWLIESCIRLIEWGVGLIHNLLDWVINLPIFDFGIFEMFGDWVKQIFSL